MIRTIFILIITACHLMAASSQSSPRVPLREQINLLPAPEQPNARELFKQGNYFYRQGMFKHAYFYLRQVYDAEIEHPALLYKLGVSALLGEQSPLAYRYFEKISDKEITADYYYFLGRAYMAAMNYSSANVAFTAYNESLRGCARRRFSSTYNKLMEQCRVAQELSKDSLPFFIICLGPTINTEFDDFAAIEHAGSSKLFFTTRRPRRAKENAVNNQNLSENVHWSEFLGGVASESTPVRKINNSHHSSVAGINQKSEILFVYTGKRHGGGLKQFSLENGEPRNEAWLNGAVNSKAFRETSISVSNAGVAYFISNRRGGQGKSDIWQARSTGERGFRRVVNLGPVINTPFNESSVHVSPDGNSLYFSSEGHPGLGYFDIFRSVRQPDGTWGSPENLGYPVNTPANDLFYFPTSDTLSALISSDRHGGFGSLDILKVKRDTRLPFSVWGEVRDKNNDSILTSRVIILDAVTGTPLHFSSQDSQTGEYFIRLEDKGNFAIRAEAPGFVSATKALPNPSTRNETIRQDFNLERQLFPFTLRGRVTNRETGAPVQAEIRFIIAGSDTVSYRAYSELQTGNYAITFADKADFSIEVIASDFFPIIEALPLKNYPGTMKEKNFTLQRSRTQFNVVGTVTDSDTREGLHATVSLTLPGQSEPVATTNSVTPQGRFTLTVEETGPFLLEVTSSGYFFANMPLQFHPDSTLIVRNIELKQMITGARIVIGNILFATGNAVLKAESYPDLNRLASLLSENRDVRVRVSGHTDNVGSASSNKRLSRERALAVKNYLVSMGITSERIEFEGHGFDFPIAPNTTPEGRAANRRVEIEVIE